MAEYEVTYTVRFMTKVHADSVEELKEKMFDIDPPEGNGSAYCDGSFEIINAFDEDGNQVYDECD